MWQLTCRKQAMTCDTQHVNRQIHIPVLPFIYLPRRYRWLAKQCVERVGLLLLRTLVEGILQGVASEIICREHSCESDKIPSYNDPKFGTNFCKGLSYPIVVNSALSISNHQGGEMMLLVQQDRMNMEG